MGDPGLLLPALYSGKPHSKFVDKTICIPHFHDVRSDQALLEVCGADLVLRASIENTNEAIENFIDALTSASFVLSSSLHGAIVAAAYGRPFAFWDPGFVDLPTKWEDFARSIGICSKFVSDMAAARKHYESHIRPCIRIPSMMDVLSVAPYPLRPEALLRVMSYELSVPEGGAGAPIDEAIRLFERRRRHFDQLVGESRELVEELEARNSQLRRELENVNAELASERKTREHVVELEARNARLIRELEGASAELEATHRSQQKALEAERVRADQIRAEAERNHQNAVRLQEHEVNATRQHAAALQRRVDSLHGEIAAARESFNRATDALNVAQLRARVERRAIRAQLFVAQEERRHLRALGSSGWRTALRAAKWRSYHVLHKLGLANDHRAVRVISSSGLFDADWYAVIAKRRFRSPLQALRHYLKVGSRQRLSPHPLFDPAYYATHNSDVVPQGVDPLLHYLRFGCWEGRKPHPLFDPVYYLDSNPDVDEAGLEPLGHYLRTGWREGRRPHPLFDVANYLATNADVREAGIEPLRHYVERGAREGRAPNGFFHAQGYAFDHEDVSDFDGNALLHYVARGQAAGFSPHPLFDPTFYAARNPDVGQDGMHPYTHYVLHGAREGRAPSRMWTGGGSFENARIGMPPIDGSPDVTVIVPAYKHFFDTYRCLYSVAINAPSGASMQVVLADDCPAKSIAPHFECIPNLSIIVHPENLGFLRGCNRAASLTRGEYVVFLNNDTWVNAGWLDRMLDLARRDPLVAMVGCKLLNADGTIQEAGGVMFEDGWGFPYGRDKDPAGAQYSFVREVDCVIGACFLVRRSAFEEVGGLNELYSPAFFEEFDLAFAFADAGYRIMYQPASVVYHLGSSSYGAELRDRQSAINHEKFAKRWAKRLSAQHQDASSLFLARSRPAKSGVILVIDDSVPEYDKHAGALTMFQYLRLLTELDFRVVYLPHNRTATWPYTGTYQQLGIEVLYGDIVPSEWLATNGRFIDYVWVARPDVATAYIDDIRRHTHARLAYYTHDLHFLREQRRYELDGDAWALSESQRLRPIETEIFQRVDVITTPSAEEAVIIRELVPGSDVRVIPPYFFEAAGSHDSQLPKVSARDKIIFVGGYRHVPNVDAAVFLIKEVMPIVWKSVPRAQVLLVGSHPPQEVLALAGPNIEVAGFVEDLAPCYAQARMSVSALRWGAGVKGKIVGSLEAGVPVVTTTVGNEGIDLVNGESVLLGDTAEELATAIVRLYRDPELAELLSRQGRRVIQERFSVASARRAVLDFLDLSICSVCGRRSVPDAQALETRKRNWREETHCLHCWALNRMEAVAQVLIQPYRGIHCNSVHEANRLLSKSRVHEFGFVGPIHDILLDNESFSRSDYLDDIAPGGVNSNGVQCEDLQALTFADSTIDLCISQDVFEHVPDPWAGFREIYRVLRPDGVHVCSIPYSPSLERSRARARLVDGVLEHLLPPEFHGDPTRGPEGALVFTDFGQDLLSQLRDIGFEVELHETHRPDTQGGYIGVFWMRKPGVREGAQ